MIPILLKHENRYYNLHKRKLEFDTNLCLLRKIGNILASHVTRKVFYAIKVFFRLVSLSVTCLSPKSEFNSFQAG